MIPPVVGSLAIALVEGQVSVVQGNWLGTSVREKETDNVYLVLSISSDPPQELEVIVFYPAGGFSFLADLKECPPILIKDILCSLPSNLSYSEGAVLEVPQEDYSKYLELKEKAQQRLDEIYAKATQNDRCTFVRG
jgi:hypothetical protein